MIAMSTMVLLKLLEKGEVKAQFMECGSILCNASLKPLKLNNHFQSVHDEKGTEIDINKKRAWFDHKATISVLEFTPPEKPIMEAWYEVSYIIDKTRALLNNGETLIKPATLKITELIPGKEAMKKIKQIS